MTDYTCRQLADAGVRGRYDALLLARWLCCSALEVVNFNELPIYPVQRMGISPVYGNSIMTLVIRHRFIFQPILIILIKRDREHFITRQLNL